MNFTACPRCHRNTLNADEPALNALSRRNSKTYICTECGNAEAFIDQGIQDRDWREMEFLAFIEKQKEPKP